MLDDVRKAYQHDPEIHALMKYLSDPSDRTGKKVSPFYRASMHRYKVEDGLLWYRAVNDDAYAVVIPDDEDLRLKVLFEYHDAPPSGHRGREKTYCFSSSRLLLATPVQIRTEVCTSL